MDLDLTGQTDHRVKEAILAYHQASKHALERYAPGPIALDWRNQPAPFRTFGDCDVHALPLAADAQEVSFVEVRAGRRRAACAPGRDSLAVLLELSFGLSAWKAYEGTRWALRCNPSSGNLHPTECYVLSAAHPGLERGVFHYVSRDHALEQRAVPHDAWWDTALSGGFVLGLSSIHWREAWKYGLRAFRYCQLDCGHALAAVSYAAATLGWQVVPLTAWGDATIAALLGLDRQDEFHPAERETPEVALWVGPQAPDATVLARIPHAELRFQGTANRLSDEHRHWPGIDAVAQASVRPGQVLGTPDSAPQPAMGALPEELTAARLIRQRRSAVDFDGQTHIPAARWFAMLDALLPRPGLPPHDALTEAPRVHLVCFVHRIADLEPGLYVLLRDAAAEPRLRAALDKDFAWERVAAAPAHLPLFRLASGDLRNTARAIACHQDIAADSCFALGMLVDFDAALAAGPWHYRELYRECGLLGQILYLEATAAGIAGTGIGCFFDDAMHRLLGITDTSWQSLYHFTVGGPLDDARLQTLPPYAQR